MTEWNATDYNRISTLQEVLAEQEIGRLKLGGSERVLDVGCGDGKVTAEIAPLVPHGSVLGVDPSHNMIDFAAAHFGAVPNLRFEVADVRNLPYRDEFDLVVSFNALHWVNEQEKALRCIRAALEPGGRALLRFVPKSDQALEYVIEEVRNRPRWAGFFANFRPSFAHFAPDEYRALAVAAGLTVAGIRVESGAWDFKSRAAFVDFCRGTFVEWTRLLPEGDRLAFITEVLDRYQAVVAARAGEEHVFKFLQMEVALRREQ
jgi:trans-aconitate methyltransferase